MKNALVIAAPGPERASLIEQLHLAGFQTTFLLCQKAIDTVFETKPRYDLIILDVLLFHIEGIALIKQLRSTRVYQTIPIYVFGPKKKPQIVLEAIKEGADDYLAYPIKMDDLRTKLYLAFNSAHSAIRGLQQQAS